MHRVGQLPVVGAEAITQYLTQKNQSLTYRAEKADIARSGDLGYAYGSYEAPAEKGYYLRVWRRGTEGKWELMADIANPFPTEKK